MKIKSININNSELFEDLTINFTDNNDKILDTIVFAGVNGSGKTTILKSILDCFKEPDKKKSFELKCYVDKTEEKVVRDSIGYSHINNEIIVPNENGFYTLSQNEIDVVEERYPKIVYMPTEINFENLKAEKKGFVYEYKFINIVDQSFIKNIPTFIADKIHDEVFKNEDLPPKVIIDKICNEINSMFEFIDLDVKIIGLKKSGNRLPIFKNSFGAEFEINSLSSGEKQLFVRAISLIFININNSIVLIDEPEISLHPEWQQKIVKLYQSIGENNQIIIATHSPHIISSVKKESLKILYKDDNKIKTMQNEEIDGAYGYNVEKVLTDIMGLKSVRNFEIENDLEMLRKMVKEDRYETEDFREKYSEVVKNLGTLDRDVILLNLGIAQKKGEKNAKHK